MVNGRLAAERGVEREHETLRDKTGGKGFLMKKTNIKIHRVDKKTYHFILSSRALFKN